MKPQQQRLPIPVAWPVSGAAERAAAAEAARVQRRKDAEQRAVDVLRSVAQAVGVDALAEHVDVDRSNLYAQARGTRPPQLATFVAALRFDPDFGREALGALAADIGCVVLPRKGAGQERRPIGAVLRELHALLDDAGVLDGEGEDVAAVG